MTLDTDKLLANWKTTAQGLLGAAVAVIVAVVALPPGARVVVYVLAGLRALVGFLQKDAGTILAETPEGDVKVVASREIPIDPADKAVKA